MISRAAAVHRQLSQPGMYSLFISHMHCLLTTFFFFFHHTTCESMCDTLPSSAANQGDNTVLVAQCGTTTPGANKQLLLLDRVLKELYIYIYIYIYATSINSRDYVGRSCSFLVCSLWFEKNKTRLRSAVDVITHLQ